jgi:hypothetical protein
MRTTDHNREGLKETIEGWRDIAFLSPILNRIWQLLPSFILWQLWKEGTDAFSNPHNLIGN